MIRDKDYWYWLVRYIDDVSGNCGALKNCLNGSKAIEKYAIKISKMTSEDFIKELIKSGNVNRKSTN